MFLLSCAFSDDAHGADLPDSIKALQKEKRTLQVWPLFPYCLSFTVVDHYELPWTVSRLQHHLRKFEEEFLKTHGRKVKFQKDIVPVAEDYQRYKVRVVVCLPSRFRLFGWLPCVPSADSARKSKQPWPRTTTSKREPHAALWTVIVVR